MRTTTVKSWEAMVREADDETYDREKHHPIVYYWPWGHHRRDAGADAAIYGTGT